MKTDLKECAYLLIKIHLIVFPENNTTEDKSGDENEKKFKESKLR